MKISPINLIIIAVLLYLLLNSGALASTTTQPQAPVVGPGCVETYRQQYSAQWAQMTVLQRAMVGLAAAGCEEGGR